MAPRYFGRGPSAPGLKIPEISLPCEHTQGYNSSPIAIIFGIQLEWVLIKGWDRI